MPSPVSYPHRGRGRPDISSTTTGSMPLKPSAPIQIPAGRRSAVLSSTSNYSQPTSPDTVFEMSPITTEFVGHQRPSFSLAQNERSAESFLYNFPSFSGRQPQTISDKNSPTPPDCYGAALCQRNRVADPLAIRMSPPPPKSSCVLDEYDLSPGFVYPDEGSRSSPSKENYDYFQPRSRRLGRLSPGPRLPSSSTSPWIMQGRGDAAAEDTIDVAYSHMDPSAFEFQRHLLQRIETQKPSHIMNMRSYM
ncbi:hypothetical protein CC1G_02960 [Coprinopsis cinerea okayama7|uniref:Uncharacterized protein n=1 Tax=Coprinopsis cinerea (strain Okayama-7 / 130 / ATCC MYA-4618 / FGSC 9003) TaxID=240176 RepID=A8NRW4_COPC7|nr:hypothetical protein CC1G_02960 [Coprinopsis cinerea okayama7\|eukprot:XP_001835872.2 hypothetical protein CC1G_02960 [Coprinopsis cinerea okayama7\